MGGQADGSRLSRRSFVANALGAFGALTLGSFASGCRPSQAGPDAIRASPESGFTQWGFPGPYRQVSEGSVAWLKRKGWWPLRVGLNPTFSEQNMTLFAMKSQRFLEKRGLRAKFPELAAASFMNEAYVPGHIQMAQVGPLGFLRLVDLGVPTAAVYCYPVPRAAFLAPVGSRLQSLRDLKDRRVLGRRAVIGITVGSGADLALAVAADTLGLKEGKDYIKKNTAPGDILPMPRGIDVTAIWEPYLRLMTEFHRNARVIDEGSSYILANAYSCIRGEIAEAAPDVVQAYVDALVESLLYVRWARQEVVAAARAGNRFLLAMDEKLLERDAEIHTAWPKPTKNYPFVDANGFWASVEALNARTMTKTGFLQRAVPEEAIRDVLRPQYMQSTFARLGWAVPAAPPFLPAAWDGTVGQLPYPPYGLEPMGPQAFPQGSDLTREWEFDGETFQVAAR